MRLLLCGALFIIGCSAGSPPAGEGAKSSPPAPLPKAAAPAGVAKKDYPKAQPVSGAADEFSVKKSNDEWKKVLTPAQYYILRESGTEPPFHNKFFDNHEHGDYFCAADHNLLFHSTEKFESGTGWPSFFAPATNESVKVTSDHSLGMSRDEIVCSKCGGHLGHVFDDGPAPTGQRYCMDSDAMTFEKN